jgi:hypothetical protein
MFETYSSKICHWLTAFSIMNFVWILVTIITDYNSVFYRKAIIYKKRVDDELQSRRQRQSFTNDSTSLFSGQNYNGSVSKKNFSQDPNYQAESSKHKYKTDT